VVCIHSTTINSVRVS